MKDFAEKFRVNTKEMCEKFMAFNEKAFERYLDAEPLPTSLGGSEGEDEDLDKALEEKSTEVNILE